MSESLSGLLFALSAALLSLKSTSKSSSFEIIDCFCLESEALSQILRIFIFLNFALNSVHSTDKHYSATSLMNKKEFMFGWDFTIF